MMKSWKWASMVTVLLVVSTVAWSQGGPGGPGGGPGRPGGGFGLGPRLTPEQAEAAWKAEAEHISSELGLSEEQSGKLTEVYVDARKNALKAWEEHRGSEQGRPESREEMREALQKLAAKTQEDLKTALSALLDEKQTESAVRDLSSFDNRGDLMVHTLKGMNLGEKEAEAMKIVTQFIVESRALMRARLDANQPQDDFRGKAMALRTKLDEDLAQILSEEQMATWKAAVGFGGGLGRRGGEGPRGPQAGGPPAQNE